MYKVIILICLIVALIKATDKFNLSSSIKKNIIFCVNKKYIKNNKFIIETTKNDEYKIEYGEYLKIKKNLCYKSNLKVLKIPFLPTYYSILKPVKIKEHW